MPLLPDLVGRIRLDMSDLSRAQGEAASRGAMIGSALGTAVGSLAGGLLAAAGQQLLDFVSGSVDAFARLEDATSVAGIRFGEAQGSVDAFARGASRSLGMSKASALEAANTFSVFGNQIGLTGQPLADFSTGLTGLAGDMASFVGTSPEEAIRAIGSAFRGEYDPIEQYGVSINAAAVEQEALRMGLIKQGQEMTQAQKVLATQSLIMQQTSAAQGDFARTGDSVANTQHRIAAETENAQAALGEKLAPAFLAVMNALNSVIGGLLTFIDFVSSVVRWVREWSDALTAVGIVLALLNARTILANVQMAGYLALVVATEAATKLWAAGQWLLNAALTANPIGLVIAAIAALVAIFVVVYNHSESFRNAVNALWSTVQDMADKVGRSFGKFVSDVGGAFQAAINWIVQFWDWIKSIPGRVADALSTFARQVWDLIVGGWQHAVDGWHAVNEAYFNFVSGIARRIEDFLSSLPGIVWRALVDGWTRAKDGAIGVAMDLIHYVEGIPRAIYNAFGNVGDLLFGIGRDIINGLLNGLKSLGGTIVSYLTDLIPGPVRDALGIASPSTVMDAIGQDTMEGLDRGLVKKLPQIRARIAEITATINPSGGFQISMPTAGGGTAGVSGQVTKVGNNYHIDARSFGTQITPRQVADAIVWNAKVGGLVPA